ncbi:MAG TPA: response regulator [Terriglobales bacterium]|jgi:CheY-like chemotaxis protein|nr:response regulator [Terriglobales bacterium]
MSNTPKRKVLIVDDDHSIRATVTMLLIANGYEASSAENGFDALLHMKSTVPELVISDLNMPQMSGFEFLSVIRRRFPQMLVVAMSGAYEAGDAVPGGVIADAFYAKGTDTPGTLLKLVADLFRTSASRTIAHTRQSAPIWVPRNGKDSRGIPYIVLTCTECLRSFPLTVSSEVNAAVMQTPCIFCLNEVRYIIDFSLSVASPKKGTRALASLAGKAGA